ncbi:Uncharacterised protein [Nocardia otitidiscaviarum]|uniref:Uncharacterized protein n=1 Tax=Nocardia otitidiscaviarum TaxID=1823 RepID=A0A378YCB8_9NOCA|nr:hypothetical protein [Nocardia otitidiscaviarum]SUA74508.1 Uncharacterised protein [Nocardia otitidiscaviarum]
MRRTARLIMIGAVSVAALTTATAPASADITGSASGSASGSATGSADLATVISQLFITMSANTAPNCAYGNIFCFVR